MQIEQVEMSPKLAKELLGKNDNNRHTNERRIAQMVGLMKAGQWRLNGGTIVVGESGRLLDGQHRLSAVVLANVNVPMLLVRGAEDSVFDTIDTGRSRRASDIAGMAGVRHRFEATAAARTLYMLVSGAGFYQAVPPQYILEVLERYPSIDGWCDRYKHARGARVLIGAGTLVPALVYLTDIAKRPELSARMIDGIEKGVSLDAGDPILAVRNRLINMRGRKVTMNVPNCWSMFARAIDALESGEPLFQVQAKRESAPVQPKRMKKHLQQVEATMRLADLPVPPVLSKIRGQKDILAKVIGK